MLVGELGTRTGRTAYSATKYARHLYVFPEQKVKLNRVARQSVQIEFVFVDRPCIAFQCFETNHHGVALFVLAMRSCCFEYMKASRSMSWTI